MSSDKLDNTNGRPKGEGEKGHYDDLYNDLPKEVVDILMQTHPLMSKEEKEETTAMRSRRRPAREDVEEIREARMQQVGSEINEIKKAPQQEGEPTKYVSRRARHNETEEEMYYSSNNGHTIEQDDYDDGIQYVSVMPARKKKRVEEVTMQTASSGKKRKSKREEMPFEDFERRPRYEDLDFEEKAKQENLDSLYNDDYDDDYDDRGRSKLPIILGVIGLALVIFLIFKCVSLSSKLENAQNQITANQDINSKYEQIQLDKMQLEEELAKLKNPNSTTDTPAGDENTTGTTGTTGGTTGAGTAGATTGGTTTEYTVAEGDTFWSIAQKVYGNGAEFQKILDANNMKESDTLRVGLKLKVPKAQ